jgi:acyl dehydratase
MTAHAAPGSWHEAPSVTVGADAVGAFAAAVGESDEELLRGRAVPTTYPFALGWGVQRLAFDGVLPTDALLVHGEQVMAYERPLPVGARVRTRARLESVAPRRTGSTVTVRLETSDGSGTICEQLFTIFVVDRELPAAGPSDVSLDADPEPVGDAVEPLGELTETVPVGQPERYADASGDRSRIHLDDEHAKAQGLPGVILHGMSTLAYAARACRVLAGGEPVFLAGRFSAPVLPGESIRTTVDAAPDRDGRVAGTFETSVVRGETAITRGRYVVRRPA